MRPNVAMIETVTIPRLPLWRRTRCSNSSGPAWAVSRSVIT